VVAVERPVYAPDPVKISMQSTLAATVASVLFLTGCGSAEPAAPTAAASTGTAAGLAGSCKAVDASFRAMVASLLRNAMSSEGPEGTDEHTASRKALTGYARTAREQAATASDPALRTALEQHATAADKLAKAADPTALDDPGFEAASGEIEKICRPALAPVVSPGTSNTKLGTAGSACVLPVAFDLLPLWKPKAVDVAELGELGSLYRNGPFTVVCEVDAKPAGEIGFLRVHTAPGRTGSPRSHLEAFIAAENPEARKAGNFEVKKTEYRDLTIGGEPAAEVTYATYNKSMDHESKYSAFALNTPKGAVVVKLSPFGADEYVNLLPAYDLAKRTLTVNR
jgi:uncharacterized lipoprotein